MGACVAKEKKVIRNMIKEFELIKMPSFSYINREEGALLSLSFKRIEKSLLPNNFKVYKDSIIVYHSEFRIYVIGGTKNSHKTSKKCFEINANSKSTLKIPSLPCPFPNSQALFHDDKIYLISPETLDLLIYNIHSKTWTNSAIVFEEKAFAKLKDFSIFIQKKKLYIIGGRYTSDIFSPDIYKADLVQLKCVKTIRKFPLNILSPKCIACEDFLVVAGVVSDQGKTCYKFCVNYDGNTNWKVLDCEDIPVFDDYPSICIGKMLVFLAFPFVIVNVRETFVVFNATFIETVQKRFKFTGNDESLHMSAHEEAEKTDSFILRARILTPINGSFIETISSSESQCSSQILHTEESSHHSQNDLPSKNFEEIGEDPNGKGSRPRKLSLLSLEKIHDIKVLVNYEQAREFMNFLINILQIKNYPKLANYSENFTLFEFEKMLLRIKYKLYPVETFKIITKALDIIFNSKKLTKNEKEYYLNVLEIAQGQEYIDKLKAIPAIIFRLKMIVLRNKQSVD